MATTIEQVLEDAIEKGSLPGAVLLAKDKNGTFSYSRAFGRTSSSDDATEPLKTNAVFRIASMSKLLTSIAAMQIVERGLINLDDDVSDIIPELGKQRILTGFDEESKPIFHRRQNPLKFRYLLTHSAGTAYTFSSPNLTRYVAAFGVSGNINVGPGIVEKRFDAPLVYEPGTTWLYGTSIDWAGKVIERLTGETLETYMQKNMFQPLGIKGITFWVDKNPEIAARLTELAILSPSLGLRPYKGPVFTDHLEDCFGGQGIYADMEDYLKILHSLLADDERLLKKETSAQMFQPNLTKESQAGLSDIMYDRDLVKAFIGHFPPTSEYHWGIGGLLLQTDEPDGRRKGSLIWSGLPNCYWFVDREAGLCGIFGTFLLPSAEPQAQVLIRKFEVSMYEKLAEAKSRL